MVRVGVGCRRAPPPAGTPVVVCGLAGSLDPGLPPGAVFVAERLGLADGWSAACDPEVLGLLVSGARRLGFEPATGAMLTSPRMVTGPERARWRELGFAAADMEAGALARSGAHVLGAVRVVLDAPGHEFSASPHRWVDGAGLALRAVDWSYRAAQVIGSAFG